MDYYPPLNNPATEAVPRPPYLNGNAAAAIVGSYPPAESAEHPMREILAVIEAANIVPSKNDLTQLLQAIKILIAQQTGTTPTPGGPTPYNFKQAFVYTGADQDFVVPAGALMLKFKIWGAAGGIWSGDPNGSAGGFTLAEFNLADGPIEAGDALKIMVGQGGLGQGIAYSLINDQDTGAAYGFGGTTQVGGSDSGWPGGGLSGIFAGSGAIAAGEAATRAMAIAGGGGGSVYRSRPGQPHSNGGYGNAVGAGGEGTMQGGAGVDTNDGGGGGGYFGGSDAAIAWINPTGGETSGAGKGGTGFVHADAVAAQILASTAGVSPPNPYDPDYQSGVGVATMAGHGLVVAEWYIPA
jgi:hypothetical protein